MIFSFDFLVVLVDFLFELISAIPLRRVSQMFTKIETRTNVRTVFRIKELASVDIWSFWQRFTGNYFVKVILHYLFN